MKRGRTKIAKRKPVSIGKARTRPKAQRERQALKERRMPRDVQPADAVHALVAASARALGLTLEPAWRRGVTFNLALILRLAGLVEQFPLPDDTEPGPVFRA